MSDDHYYKINGLVTNREGQPATLLTWARARCGKGEEVHAVLKRDLGAGRLPSQHFAPNAAWWALNCIAFNLHSLLKQLLLRPDWRPRRLQTLRQALLNIPGQVTRHARRYVIRLTRDHLRRSELQQALARIHELTPIPT